MSCIFSIAWLGVLIWLGLKCCNKQHEEQADNLNFLQADKDIDNLYELKKEVRLVEDLITEINACSDKKQMSFDLSWQSEHDGILTYQFWIDGSNQNLTEALLWLAEVERERLRLSLQNDIQATAERSVKNRFDTDKRLTQTTSLLKNMLKNRVR